MNAQNHFLDFMVFLIKSIHLNFTCVKKILLTYSIALILGVLILSSCSEDERPLPMATSEFVVATIAPEVHLPVYFENNSLNAAYYVWDFGDGSEVDSAKSVSISHVYEEPGNYTVKLRAYNEDGAFQETEQTVDVGERYMTGISIAAIGTRDGNGNKIDTVGVKALLLFAKDTDNETELGESLIRTDTFDLGGNFPLPGFALDFDYVLEDQDYFIEVYMTTNDDPVILSGYTFNPLNPSITLKDEDGLGGIILPPVVGEDGYQFVFSFEIK